MVKNKSNQIWKLEFPNLSQKEAYKKLHPKINKYIGKI